MSEIKGKAGLVSPEASLLGLLTAINSLCPPVFLLLCVSPLLGTLVLLD